MRSLKILYLLLGVALLGAIVAETDLGEAARLVLRMGWGMAVVVLLYLMTFSIDSFTWLVTLGTRPLSAAWIWRMWKVRLVGEAFNMTVPAGGMGGEPVKAILLKRHYDVDYHHGTASLFLVKTVNMIALGPFLAAGFVLMLHHPALTGGYALLGGLGFAAFAAATALFFAIQRYRVSSAVAAWLGRWRLTQGLARILDHVHEVERHFAEFYLNSPTRFAGAVALGFAGWAIGVLEVYYALAFLGRPVTLAEAWVIEAMAQMVRAGAFFIPAALGMQDGAFVLLCAAITGSPELGVAAALVRRFREIIWIAAGFALGSAYHLAPGADRGADSA